MTKNILILKGSPRENGNSANLADQAAAGNKPVSTKRRASSNP
ncbi:MAG: hypothetical protein NTV38_12780 [Chloroflexi bacterium]|nr:hypothetical protein [Chloroflexota bacterium]